MYNFFSNKIKRKAFIKALKEVEQTGVYADYTADENAARLRPDVEAEIAALTKKEKANTDKEETLDITELSMNDISQATVEELKSNPKIQPIVSEDVAEPVQLPQQEQKFTTREQTIQYYDRMFARKSFLDGQADYADVEFVDSSNQNNQELAMQMEPDTSIKQPEQTQAEEKPRESLTNRVLDRMVKDNQDRKATELKEQQDRLNRDREEFLKLQQQEAARREAQQKELEQREQSARLAAEQAEESRRQAEAAAAKAAADVAAAAAQAAAATSAIVVATAPKPKRKQTTPRKRKRRYDADIIGDFDF